MKPTKKSNKLAKTFFIITICVFLLTISIILMFLTEPLTWKIVTNVVIKIIGALLFLFALFLLRVVLKLYE